MKNKLISISFIFICILLIQCKSKKSSIKDQTNQPEEEVDLIKEQAPDDSYFKIKDGFSLYTVTNKYQKENCDWLIENEDGEILNPNNLDDMYKKEGVEIWVIFKTIRPVQRNCFKGKPINILKIEIAK